MGDPVSNSNVCRTPVPNYDAMMSEATGLPLSAGVTVNRTPEAPRHGAGGAIATGSVSVAIDTIGEGVATGGGVAMLMLGGAIGAYEQLAAVVHTLEDGEKARVLHDHTVLRGALAYFEGRAGSPEVVNRAQRDPAFAEGLRRADTFVRTNVANADRVTQFARTIRMASDAGISAVVGGRDSGAEFECRLSNDAVFRDGVTYARALREGDPAEFARRQVLEQSVSDARRAQLRP